MASQASFIIVEYCRDGGGGDGGHTHSLVVYLAVSTIKRRKNIPRLETDMS